MINYVWALMIASGSMLADPPKGIRAYEKKDMLGGSYILVEVRHKSSDLTGHYIASVTIEHDGNVIFENHKFKQQSNKFCHHVEIPNEYELGDDHITIAQGTELTITAICNRDLDKPVTKTVKVQGTP